MSIPLKQEQESSVELLFVVFLPFKSLKYYVFCGFLRPPNPQKPTVEPIEFPIPTRYSILSASKIPSHCVHFFAKRISYDQNGAPAKVRI